MLIVQGNHGEFLPFKGRAQRLPPRCIADDHDGGLCFEPVVVVVVVVAVTGGGAGAAGGGGAGQC